MPSIDDKRRELTELIKLIINLLASEPTTKCCPLPRPKRVDTFEGVALEGSQLVLTRFKNQTNNAAEEDKILYEEDKKILYEDDKTLYCQVLLLSSEQVLALHHQNSCSVDCFIFDQLPTAAVPEYFIMVVLASLRLRFAFFGSPEQDQTTLDLMTKTITDYKDPSASAPRVVNIELPNVIPVEHEICETPNLPEEVLLDLGLDPRWGFWVNTPPASQILRFDDFQDDSSSGDDISHLIKTNNRPHSLACTSYLRPVSPPAITLIFDYEAACNGCQTPKLPRSSSGMGTSCSVRSQNCGDYQSEAFLEGFKTPPDSPPRSPGLEALCYRQINQTPPHDGYLTPGITPPSSPLSRSFTGRHCRKRDSSPVRSSRESK